MKPAESGESAALAGGAIGERPHALGLPTFVLSLILPMRLLINAQYRIVFPFLPAIARGLGLPLDVASLLLTVRGLLGLVSPACGYLSDRIGRKGLMLAGLLALAAGAGLVAVSRSFGIALVAFALLGLAKSSYDPAVQAYVADRVPFERRGRALGVLELSWAGSWLIGVPLAGVLISRWDWRAPFLVIAVLALIGWASTLRLRAGGSAAPDRPAHDVSSHAVSSHAMRAHAMSDLLRPLKSKATILILLASGLIILANDSFFIIYGGWMESRFGLSLVALGLASTVVSLAELSAAGLSAGSIDRLGKRRALLVSLALNTIAYLILPLCAGRLTSALAGLVFLALTSEFCIVSVLPLVSELAPEARGTVLAVNAGLAALATAGASLMAPRLWYIGNLGLVTAFCGACALLAAVLVFVGARNSGIDKSSI